MRIGVFDTRRYDREPLEAENAGFGHELVFFEPRLTRLTAGLARGFPAVCVFVSDALDAAAVGLLAEAGVKLVALRCAGYNNVDLEAAERAGLAVVRVPEYSPYAVAEHAVLLALALDRKIHRAYVRVREGNFSLDGLVGFDLHGKTVGIVGTGHIGEVAARIFRGFGCRVLAYDVRPRAALVTELDVEYVDLGTLFPLADVISLHVPLTPETRHLVDASAIERMKPGVLIVNTGRGALIDTRALVAGLKSGRIGAAGLDVYEEEEGVFFRDLSDEVIQDDVLARLLTFPNVLVTAHQGFLTREALSAIARTTLASVRAFERGEPLHHRVSPESARPKAA